jgi:hypothetical protein
MRGLLATSLLLSLTGCQSCDVVTFRDDAGVDESDAGVDEPDAGVEEPDAGQPDAGVDEPDAGPIEPPCTIEPAFVPFECEDDADWCDPVDQPSPFNDLAAMWSRREGDEWVVEMRTYGRIGTYPIYPDEEDGLQLKQYTRSHGQWHHNRT